MAAVHAVTCAAPWTGWATAIGLVVAALIQRRRGPRFPWMLFGLGFLSAWLLDHPRHAEEVFNRIDWLVKEVHRILS